MVDHARQLSRGAEQMGIALSEHQAEQLLAYMALLNKWNKAYNLTAVRDPNEMVSRHLLDSLSVLPHVEQGRWLDVGSGGGMPGVILAIMLPDSEFTLLDSNGNCSYIDAYNRAVELHPTAKKVSVRDKTCLCTHMRNFDIWTCGQTAYRLKDTTTRQEDGSYRVLTAEHVFRDYQFSVDQKIALPAA